MRKTSKENLKEENGITLIALVVTIVILLILAGISINAVLGENGIIRRAEQARQHQANAEASDSEALNEYDQMIANAMADIEENAGSEETPEITDTTPAGTVVKTPEEWTTLVGEAISDGNGTAIPLPDGFYYVGGDYDTGLVISDKENDTMDASGVESGNQFVWIPVESDATFIREGFDDGAFSAGEFTEPFNYTKVEFEYDLIEGNKEVRTTYTGYETETSEYNTMRTQVVKYGGFYIGRYEAGINSTTFRTGSTSTAQEVVSKKGVAPYNYVKWGDSMSSIGTNGAVYIAQNMYTGKTQANSVTSTLVYGVQWDAMCRYIGDYTRTTDTKDAIELTGSVSTDVSKNIYDLAGNCCEWTMEAYDIGYRVPRGGPVSSNSVSSRIYPPADNYDVDYDDYNRLSFRCGLYIK